MSELAAPPLPEWLASMFPAGVQRRMVDVGGLRMHVAEWGTGLPVVMLHGNPSWGFLWRKVVGELVNARLRLIVPDLVGLGLSDKPRAASAHTLANHGRWFATLLDRLGVDELVFVGQDWGGPVGLWALAERIERLRGLVLLNTVVGPPKPGFRPTAFHRFARLPLVADAVFRLGGFPQNAMTLTQGDRGSIRGAIARGYRWPLRRLRDRTAPLAMARMVPDSLAHPSIEALERCQTVIERFRGPTAIVWGDRDPMLGRVRSHLERLLPQAAVTRTRAGHFLQEEVPREIAAAIAEVAARAEAN